MSDERPSLWLVGEQKEQKEEKKKKARVENRTKCELSSLSFFLRDLFRSFIEHQVYEKRIKVQTNGHQSMNNIHQYLP